MLNRTYDQVCSIARTLEVVGERWTLLIVRDTLLGLHRFDQVQGSLGIARNVLTDRLSRLVEAGILHRTQYQEHPPRFEYHVAEKGLDLVPAVVALMQWGDRHLDTLDGPPRLARHSGCGSEVTVQPVCSRCGSIPTASVEMLPGPGLPD